MATSLDFSRAVNLDIKATSGAKFTGAVTFARDDSVAVDWTGKTVYWYVFKNEWSVRTSAVSLTSWDTTSDPTKITVSTATITFNSVIEKDDGTDLTPGKYYHHFKDSDGVIVAYGELDLI